MNREQAGGSGLSFRCMKLKVCEGLCVLKCGAVVEGSDGCELVVRFLALLVRSRIASQVMSDELQHRDWAFGRPDKVV